MNTQQYLFGMEEMRTVNKKPCGGSNNPIVFRDYDSFVAKFKDCPKTTDDCYTPSDVYEAVVEHVGTITDMSGKVILRPFFPGGDFLNAEYPENGVVIDNPPFSMFTTICKFYSEENIPFFLFGPGLTIASCCPYCTAVIINNSITFENGANISVNFASNLYGDVIVTTEPELGNKIAACASQRSKRSLPSFEYPNEVLSISDLQSIAKNGIKYSVMRKEAHIIKDLDNYPNDSGLFGNHFLICETKASEKEYAKTHRAQGGKAKQQIILSRRERNLIKRLG